MSEPFIVASSPHIRADLSTQKIMGLVLLALIPAGAAGVHFLGTRSLAVIVVSVIACAASEAIWQTCAGQPVTARDLSAVVTGLLLAYNLPPSIPLWMAAVGGVFSMIIVKQFFGGIGQNIVNPALAGRAMMLICWPVQMTSWTVQGVSGATSLAIIKGAESAAADITGLPSLADAFLGRMGGCIGETSALALIAGGVFLMAAGVISWRIPAVYIATVAALSVVLGRSGGPVLEILSGGLMLGAFFMATDYTTSPITPKGQLIFAFGCGLVTSLIRAFGGYPEGVSYSILIMNLVVPLIDRATKPKILGEAKAR